MSKLLTEQDFKNTANNLQVEVAAIKAVAHVESRGDGFFSNGKPKILFEAHIFSSKTGHKYDDTHSNISSRRWNRKLYKWGEKEYERLEEAIKLDKVAALKSASWGKFQVMGFNAELCGWADVETFVDDMYKSEAEHLKAFAGFITANKLAKYLRVKDWAKFARAYNGPAYAQNKYDVKMKEAYEKYVKEVVVEEPNTDTGSNDDSNVDFGGGTFGGDGSSGNY